MAQFALNGYAHANPLKLKAYVFAQRTERYRDFNGLRCHAYLALIEPKEYYTNCSL